MKAPCSSWLSLELVCVPNQAQTSHPLLFGRIQTPTAPSRREHCSLGKKMIRGSFKICLCKHFCVFLFKLLLHLLTQGKVKVVSENYTTSYTCPSPGYDCHVAVSKNIVPSKASPCQAFEQSQVWGLEQKGCADSSPAGSRGAQRWLSCLCSFCTTYFHLFPFSP